MVESKPFVTAEELERRPQDDMRYELVKGELIQMPPVGEEHGDIALGLGMRLRAYAQQHRLGRVTVEVGFILERSPDTVRGPDIAFIAAERLAPGGPRKGFVPGAPDLAVEIVSPNDTFAELQSKVREYLSHGTQLVWVVEPASRTIAIYHPEGLARLLGVEDVLDGEEVLPGFQVKVGEVF